MPGGATDVTCLGWGVNFTDTAEARARVESSGLSLDEVLSHVFLGQTNEAFPDLPRDLALLNIEDTLPKLSVLSSGTRE